MMATRRGNDHGRLADVSRWIFAAALILALTLFSGLARNASSSQGNVKAPDMTGALEALRKFKVVADEDTDIPPGARDLLIELKHQARDLILETFDTHPGGPERLKEIRKALSAELARQQAIVERSDKEAGLQAPADDKYIYVCGDIPRIAVNKVPGHPDLIAATTTIKVIAASDSSFYLLKRNGQRWDLILAQEANCYEGMGDAQNDFRYFFPLPSYTGEFFVLTENSSFGYTSAWMELRYRVARPGPAPYQPRILLDRRESVYGPDDCPVTMMPKGFEIRFYTSQDLDVDTLIRDHTERYEVKGDKVRRVPPFSSPPDGFLDEWLSMPWDEASRWIAPSASAELHKWHEWFRPGRFEGFSHFSTRFVFAPGSCKVGREKWLVGVEFAALGDKDYLPKGMPKEAYFTIIKKGGNYFLTGVSLHRDRRCERRRGDAGWRSN